MWPCSRLVGLTERRYEGALNVQAQISHFIHEVCHVGLLYGREKLYPEAAFNFVPIIVIVDVICLLQVTVIVIEKIIVS